MTPNSSGPSGPPARKKILKDGKGEILVLHSGMRQRIEFVIVREETPVGPVPYLKTDRWVNATELLRVAEQMDLPIIAPSGKYFAPGKKALDYVGF